MFCTNSASSLLCLKTLPAKFNASQSAPKFQPCIIAATFKNLTAVVELVTLG